MGDFWERLREYLNRIKPAIFGLLTMISVYHYISATKKVDYLRLREQSLGSFEHSVFFRFCFRALCLAWFGFAA